MHESKHCVNIDKYNGAVKDGFKSIVKTALEIASCWTLMDHTSYKADTFEAIN